MSSYINNTKLVFVFFILFVGGYALLFIIKPALGPTDDFVFLRTLQSGKPLIYWSESFPYYDWLRLGRFHPLVSMEYNFIELFSRSPFWYFFYHSIQFIVFTILFVKLLKKVAANKPLIYFTSILLFLLPGFTISWFRLQLPERNVVFFFAAFLLCYLAYRREQKTLCLLAGLLFANIAIYYKEIAFMSLGTFALSELFLFRKTANPKIKFFNRILILSSFIYLIAYYFYVFRHSALLYLSHGTNNPLFVILKNIANYMFFSDPVLILLLIPLTIWRIYKILFKQDGASIYDSMLIAASAYIASLFILNIYGPYYSLPAYIFAIPALIHFLTIYYREYRLLRIASLTTIFLLTFNTLPSGIHYLTYNKYLPINFNKAVDFLIDDIDSRSYKDIKDRPSIFLDGVDRGAGRGTYFILAEFLEFKGLSSKKFDMRSELESKESFSPVTKIQPPFTVFKAGPPSKIEKGDYLIITPQTAKNINQGYLQALNKDYRLISQTTSHLAFPDINLKTLLKYYLFQGLSQKQKSDGALLNENILNWPDYYVFVKK